MELRGFYVNMECHESYEI